MLHEELGKVIDKRGLKVADVWKMTGKEIPRSTVYAVFKGDIKDPSYTTTIAIQKALRLPTSFFIEAMSNKVNTGG